MPAALLPPPSPSPSLLAIAYETPSNIGSYGRVDIAGLSDAMMSTVERTSANIERREWVPHRNWRNAQSSYKRGEKMDEGTSVSVTT